MHSHMVHADSKLNRKLKHSEDSDKVTGYVLVLAMLTAQVKVMRMTGLMHWLCDGGGVVVVVAVTTTKITPVTLIVTVIVIIVVVVVVAAAAAVMT